MDLRSLILNVAAQPHGIVTWRKAVTLAFKNRVDVLENYVADIGGMPLSIEIPAVIKLREPIVMHKDGIKYSRANVYTRDGYRCCYCNLRFHPRDLTYDHVVPKSQGGKTVWENIVTACMPCNLRKDRKTPHQAGMKMFYVPYRPHSLGTRPLLVDLTRAPREWLPYLEGQQRMNRSVA